MIPPYSERFFVEEMAAGDPDASYVVPSGKRAIVTCLTVFDASVGTTGASVAFYMTPPGYPILVAARVPSGVGTMIYAGLHVVIYAGETFGCARYSSAVTVSAHGYLLSDP